MSSSSHLEEEPLGGLALGEFEPGEEEVIEEDSDGQTHRAVIGSGAISRSSEPYNSDSQLTPRNASRRRAVHSLSSYESDSVGARTQSMDEARITGDHSDAQSAGLYSYDEGEEHEVFDGDGELNAVYLKRNADFHTLFRNIPINELLIDDYGCALQRDILVQGRLYLTENFVCFYSNIFGWVTNLVIDIDEIVSVEKKMTALIIPNAIQVSTLHAKYFFGSFIYRDSAYNQLIDLWSKSRNEKNAGLPEIGHAEGGDGAGDVSRHRGDVLTAYQSLSEDEDEEEEEEDPSGSEYSNGNASDTEDSASDASDNDDVKETALPEAAAEQATREVAGGSTNQIKVIPAVTRTLASDAASASEGSAAAAARDSDHANAGEKSAAESAAGSSVQLKTGNGTPASVTRAGSSQSVAKTPVAGDSAVTLSNGLAVPKATLLARLPNTPDESEPAPQAKSQDDKPSEVPLHKPTTCSCGSGGTSAHYATEALDAVFPISLPVLFRVAFSGTVPADIENKYIPADKVNREELAKSLVKRYVEVGNSDVKTEGWVPDPSESAVETCLMT
ncbi:hypothetical protein FBU59_004589, partial [Linderina macrospora]